MIDYPIHTFDFNMVAFQQEIISDEGMRRHAYQDSKGILTIGIGRNIDKKINGPGLSHNEIMRMLWQDVAECVEDLKTLFQNWDRISDARKRALISMRFMGYRSFRGFKKMIAAVNAEDWDRAAMEALDSKWAREDVQKARSERIAKQLRDGY
jgi:lysozyme